MIGRAALAALALVGAARPTGAMLDTPGFRAVGVAHSAYPMSALAVAPDGRLFAAIQAKGQSFDPDPGTAEIRVYSAYATADGSVLDEGAVWATVANVRATTTEEGLLGLALAPDFATSKLVYVYVTTTDNDQDQQIRVYRENGAGTGDYVGTVAPGLEPPMGSATRNGGPLVFGPDGCLYAGVGDNGSSNRWNAQLLTGTDPLQGSENSALCTDVCLDGASYPPRSITNDGALNYAGKILRLAVEGASPAQPAPGAPLTSQPYVFGTGVRSPAGFAVHPLTGQLYMAERGDNLESEVSVVDRGSDLGWPCLDGTMAAQSASCLGGHDPEEVYDVHPDWRRPVVTHTQNPTPTGVAVYTGLGYPAEFYGDVFYLLRTSARIYRIDLQPPCFLPNRNGGITPLAFHDSNDDGDFTVLYDIDGDHELDEVQFTSVMAIVQAPNPLGQQVLYVAAKQGNSNALTEDSVIFRIEYATSFVPYGGPGGRVPDTCFDGTGYENPFARPTCLAPGGPCPGQPDGTPCDDGDVCNGTETCHAGICQHAAPAADGTVCVSGVECRAIGACSAGRCVPGGPVPDGTPCGGGDPCAGGATCAAGVCQPGGAPPVLNISSMSVTRTRKKSAAVTLSGSFHPSIAVAPQSTDAFRLELRDGADAVFSTTLDHPASDPFWHPWQAGMRYRNRTTELRDVAFWADADGTVHVVLRARGGRFSRNASPRLVVGSQCFVADLAGKCGGGARKLRCRAGRSAAR